MRLISKILMEKVNQPNLMETRFIKGLMERRELIAALISGLFILIGWLLSIEGWKSASVPLYFIAFIIGGFAKAKEGIVETIKDKKLNVEILMILAAMGSALIGYWAEGAVLIFIFALSGALETYTMNRSEREISSLMKMQPQDATLLVDGKQEKVNVTELKIGDHIFVKPGEHVPVDGIVKKGESTIDESTITGESLPKHKSIGDQVFAGTVNVTGSMTIEVIKVSSDTLFQKIINLVKTAQNEKSPSQQFIEKFEGNYVKVVIVVVGIMMFLPHLIFDWSWKETLYRAMVLLVVASPCALIASIMPATLSAISNGARNGILFKAGVHLENLGVLKAVAFDKTGTLTRGEPEVTDFIITNNERESEIKRMVASIESHSNHPLAKAIVQHVLKEHVDLIQIEGIKDVSGFGIQASFNDELWRIGKREFVEIEQVSENFDFNKNGLSNQGKSLVYIQKNGEVIGIIALKDKIREDSQKALSDLNNLGITTIMITGDNEITAKNIAQELQLTDYIANCLPEHKLDQIKKLKDQYKSVGMVGDGVNDAPALATSSVGIAMGEGTDVALETADVVLMKNELIRIPQAIRLSRKMNKIIKQNTVFSITIILLLITSNFLQILNLPLGVIGHEGSTILVILNGLRLLKN